MSRPLRFAILVLALLASPTAVVAQPTGTPAAQRDPALDDDAALLEQVAGGEATLSFAHRKHRRPTSRDFSASAG